MGVEGVTKGLVLGLVLAVGSGAAVAQSASEMKSGAPATRPGETDEQHGRRLLDEMLKALGGEAWLNRGTVYTEGSVAAFFRGQPTGSVVRFVEYKKLATPSSPELVRTEYLTVRGMIMPGMKKDVAHLWTADNGYELTFKGRTTLPAEQVQDYIRRRAHTLDAVMKVMVEQPGVIIVAEGTGMRDRIPIDEVTVLAPNNDAVTIELDQETHLPVERSFEWRNEKFKDHDIDEEVYGDWRMIQGIGTPMNMQRYRDGDMVSQTFYTKIEYGKPMPDSLFNPDVPWIKK
jgi:hypothetical protein